MKNKRETLRIVSTLSVATAVALLVFLYFNAPFCPLSLCPFLPFVLVFGGLWIIWKVWHCFNCKKN